MLRCVIDFDSSDFLCILGNFINPSFVTNEEIVPEEIEIVFVENKLAQKRINFVLFISQCVVENLKGSDINKRYKLKAGKSLNDYLIMYGSIILVKSSQFKFDRFNENDNTRSTSCRLLKY